MKVQVDTKDTTVYISANDIAQDLETIDKWIKALKIAREWMRKELGR
jgi:ribosome-binding factor A